jgi:predicted CoA-binding protein
LDSLSEETIKHVLKNYHNVAVVGLSRDPNKPSHIVAAYLQSNGYHIIPVNPFADQILGEKSYKSLLDVPETFDVVDIFRPSEAVPTIIEQAIAVKNRTGSPTVIWMQLGIINEEAARRAKEAGFVVVMNRCMQMEHIRLTVKGELPVDGKIS